MTLSLPLLFALGGACAAAGAFGGIGGATLLVPLLLMFDVAPVDAAPLGLLAVAAGSLSAASRQLDDGLVHHRLGLTIELTASIGTVLGALIATDVPERLLALVLGASSLAGGVVALARRGMRNLPVESFDAEQTSGEWPGTLGGQYVLAGHVVPYQARRVPAGLAASTVAGFVAGLSGVGGGFLKTPALSEIMGIPVKVAAATTTFTLGITAATGLSIYWIQGRLDTRSGAAVVLGAIVGGLLGARFQSRIPATAARRITGSLLLVVAAVVIGRAL